ncbi:MAG: hypothetical protein QM496_15145 [Verrucomicrobiota bacterium]
MAILKSIFSAYIGVYLILPGCLCQMLTPFGINVLHAPPDGSAVANHSVPVATLTAPATCPSPVDCNCDDTSLKTAEQSVVSNVLYQVDIFKATAPCPWAELDILPTRFSNPPSLISSRAPPDCQRPYSLKRPSQTLYGIMLV